jgi:hypothetical protein
LRDDVFDHLSEDAKRYANLVTFLIEKDGIGAVSSERAAEMLTVDSELYRDYFLPIVREGARIQIPSLRAVQAAAAMQARFSKLYPEFAPELERITGLPSKWPSGMVRYLKLMEFLHEKKSLGQLSDEAHMALVNLDPQLYDTYSRWHEQRGIDVRSSRATLAADAIIRELSIQRPSLADEFDQRSQGRSR